MCVGFLLAAQQGGGGQSRVEWQRNQAACAVQKLCSPDTLPPPNNPSTLSTPQHITLSCIHQTTLHTLQGKSTLIKAVAGLRGIDTGRLVVAPNVAVGYLAQTAVSGSTRTVYEEARAAMTALAAAEAAMDAAAAALEAGRPEAAQVGVVDGDGDGDGGGRGRGWFVFLARCVVVVGRFCCEA